MVKIDIKIKGDKHLRIDRVRVNKILSICQGNHALQLSLTMHQPINGNRKYCYNRSIRTNER
jgi:hypothetical protein